MNILFISQLYPLSEKSSTSFALHYFVKEWIKNNNVQVIKPHLPAENEQLPAEKEITFENVKINVVKPRWIPLLKISLINHNEVLKLIKVKPDVIICHLYNSYLTYSFLKYHFNVPLIVGIHMSDALLAKNPYQRMRIKNVIKRADAISYRSRAVKRNFEKKINPKGTDSFICISGISKKLIEKANNLLANTNFTKKDNIKFISVCRLLKLKQIDKVLMGLAELGKEGYCWEYKIIGDGPEKQKLQNLTKELKLEKRVTFAGQLPKQNVFQEMEQHDIFVMPSYKETLGLVFLEAMANGCIVIGAKEWGIDGIVENGNNGFLSNPFNLNEITLSLRKIFTYDVEKLNQIRKNSLNTIINYSEEKMADHYLEKIKKHVRK